jgi:hypothetical protein
MRQLLSKVAFLTEAFYAYRIWILSNSLVVSGVVLLVRHFIRGGAHPMSSFAASPACSLPACRFDCVGRQSQGSCLVQSPVGPSFLHYLCRKEFILNFKRGSHFVFHM